MAGLDRDAITIPASTPLTRYSARIASGDALVCMQPEKRLGNKRADDADRHRQRHQHQHPRVGPEVAQQRLARWHQGTLLANEAGELAGIITRGDVVRALEHAPNGDLSVAEAGQTNLIVTYPDETLHDAIAKLLRYNIGRLPVGDRTHPKRVVGYLGRAGILAARQRYHHEEDVRERGIPLRKSGRRIVNG